MDVSPASGSKAKEPMLGPKADRWFEETQSWVAADSLRSLLALALPDKADCIDGWLSALQEPSVCVSSLDDVRRLDAEDITSLPVPPLVKGVFRYVLKHEHRRLQEAQDVLEATKARARAFTAPLRDRNMQPPLAGSKYFQDLKSYRLVLTKEEIEAGVRITAHRIETWCKGERIVLVAILKGAFMFLSDLCRTLVRPYSVYFVEASSYKAGRTQEGVQIAMDVSADKFQDTTTGVPSKIVLLDELLDNGKTMQEVRQHFLKMLASTHTENDLLTVCLFSKKRPREYPEADITGIPDLPDLWLVGYGLDDRGTKRGWTELFAIPKVKIVETIEQEEVEKLLSNLDESAVMKGPMVFGLREFTHNQKIRYRVTGLDVHGGLDVQQGDQSTRSVSRIGQTPGAKVTCKADILSALEGVATLKGKFEKELKFAFIQENVALVLEDNIFSGDNQVYAEMRCRLRRQIATSAKRFGVEGVREAEAMIPQQQA